MYKLLINIFLSSGSIHNMGVDRGLVWGITFGLDFT